MEQAFKKVMIATIVLFIFFYTVKIIIFVLTIL